MQFYYIRHAQSVNNALWAETGASAGRSEDPELTELGRRQAHYLAEFLKTGSPLGGFLQNGRYPGGFQLTHIYSSYMLRAVETGSEAARGLGLLLRAWRDAHEVGGIYLDDEQTGQGRGMPGKTRSYFQAHFPQFAVTEDLDEQGWWRSAPPEPVEAGIQRARRFFDDLLARHGDTEDRVAVVSHGGFYNAFLQAVLGLPPKDGSWFVLNNAAITRLDFHHGAVDLVYHNRMDFLPRELIT